MTEKKYVFLEVGGRDCQFLTNDNICVLDGDCENCPHGKTLEEIIKTIHNTICCKCTASKHDACNNCAVDYRSIEDGLKALLGGGGK
jgi:hypothetical protein